MAASSYLKSLQYDLFDSTMVPVMTEMMRLFPDGLVIASGLYALVTLSFPFAVFFGSMVETTVIYRFIRWIATYTNMTGRIYPTVSANTHICRTGFTQPSATMTTMSMFGEESVTNPFPSAPIFMLAAASSYIFTTLNNQSKDLETLGPAFASRYYVSAVFLITLLAIFAAFRIINQCDSFGVVMITIPIGLIVGALLVQQNARLWGSASINLMGIPLLRSRTADGKKLYVCPK